MIITGMAGFYQMITIEDVSMLIFKEIFCAAIPIVCGCCYGCCVAGNL